MPTTKGHITVNDVTNWGRLLEPFDPYDVKWRANHAGIRRFASKQDEPWCLVVPYIRSTACQERLDEVFGTSGWQTDVRDVSLKDGQPGFICRLSVYDEVREEWIHKEDGAPGTHIESFKGGVSDAFKRVCASGYGIGRYLRYLPKVIFAQAQWGKGDGWEKAQVKDKEAGEFKTYYWYIDGGAVLQPWALPGGSGKPEIVNH